MAMISPNELHAKAKEFMLNGADPHSEYDWILCVNFWATNIKHGLEVEVCLLMAMLYACPLPKDTVKEIAKFQSNKRSVQS